MPRSLHERALDDLGRRIIDGRLAPGTVVLAEQLAGELGVGRSVIREAVRVLRSLGLVTSVQRVGIRVLPESDWNVFDPQVVAWRIAGPAMGRQLRSLTELRSAVEPAAAALAAHQINDADSNELLSTAAQLRTVGRSGDLDAFLELDIRFHTLVLIGSGNEMFAAMEGIIGAVLRGRTDLGLMPSRPHEEALQLHVDVADAVQGGHSTRAHDAMKQIVTRTVDEVQHIWADLPRS